MSTSPSPPMTLNAPRSTESSPSSNNCDLPYPATDVPSASDPKTKRTTHANSGALRAGRSRPTARDRSATRRQRRACGRGSSHAPTNLAAVDLRHVGQEARCAEVTIICRSPINFRRTILQRVSYPIPDRRVDSTWNGVRRRRVPPGRRVLQCRVVRDLLDRGILAALRQVSAANAPSSRPRTGSRRSGLRRPGVPARIGARAEERRSASHPPP